MKKQIINLGKVLNKAEQKEVSGGRIPDLSRVCGYILFRSYESQCLNMAVQYRPIWNASTGMCSVLGNGTNCLED